MKNINGFDFVKFILCYWVVAIHCGLDHYSSIGMRLAELAVPIYFVISGFLIYKYIYGIGNFSCYIKRHIEMYFLYTILYFPLTLLGIQGLPLSKSIIDVLQGIFIVGENYCSWPLWYLLALIWGAIIIKLLTKLKINLESLVVIGFVLALLARMLDALHPIANYIASKSDITLVTGYFSIFENTRNGLFVGLPYLSVGLLLRKHCSKMKKCKYMHLFIGGAVFLIAYRVRLPYASQLVALVVVLFALKFSLPNKTCYITMRQISTLIYFIHMYIVWAFGFFFKNIEFLWKWGIVSVIITLFSFSLIALSKRCPYLEKLYK